VLVRRLLNLEALPLPRAGTAADLPWLQELELTLDLMLPPTGVSGTGDIGIRLIERGEERVNALMEAAGIRPDHVAVPSDPQALDALKAAATAAMSADLAARRSGRPSDGAAVAQAVQTLGALATHKALRLARPIVALMRARQAGRLGSDIEADQWYRTALERAADAGAADRWLELLILDTWGKHDEARAALATALQERLVPARQLAALAVRSRDYVTARTLFAQAPAKDDSDWSDAANRAEVALETGDGAAALALVSRAIAAFENMINRFARDADRVSASDDVSAAALYLLASRIHLRLAQAAERGGDVETAAAERALAFGVADRHRALALPPDLPGAATSDALRQWQQFATEHATAYQRLLAALTLGTGDARALMQSLAQAERVLAEVEARLTPPEQQTTVAQARRVAPFTAQDAQRLLPSGTCLLEYQVVARDIIKLAITDAGVLALESRLDHGSFEGLTSRFVRACAAGAPSPDADALAAILLAPFATILNTHERVIVVPSGALNAVPFHALPFQGKPLGASHAVSYLPAATLLRRGAVDRPLASGGTLVVGDPAFNPATHPLLQRLAGAAVEATAVAAVHGAEPYVGAQATEAALRPLLRNPTLLHFAAHGRLDEIAPNTSSIVLAGDDELTVSDLIGLDIGADLAVLSACDTGRGTTTMGGDLVGLVRGLLAAGVRRCVVSLWPVDDVAACVTMAALHRRLKDGTAPAAALAQAQREIRALSGTELAERYRALGGTLAAGERAVRRKQTSAVRLSAYPEVDAEEDTPVQAQGGELARIWAPFELIGV
jgi:hypothetical protein